MPTGTLTPAQYELMQIVWDCGRTGATVADVWEAVARQRPVARTTILNLLDRLEKRGWLRRIEDEGANRFVAAVDRDRTNARLASGFVDEFFGGSAANLVMSLLGSAQLDRDEIQRLRKLLASAASESKEGRQ
jgi:predicted transcriptional regulator